MAAKRPRKLKKHQEEDIHSDIYAETSPSEDAENQGPFKYSENQMISKQKPKIISAIEGDIIQETDIVDSSTKNPIMLNQLKSTLESDQPDVEGKCQKPKNELQNELQNEKATTTNIDMDDST